VIRIVDRYLIQLFLRAFVICFASLVGLYIVIDAFSNLDEFSERSRGLVSLLATMCEYYSFKICFYFDRLAGVITTMSAMFTFSWIQRTNELMPLLAAGVSARRVVAPVLIAAGGIFGLTTLNQELVIPRIAKQLQRRPDDDSIRTIKAQAAHDSRGILFSGDECNRQALKVTPAYITLQPPTLVSSLTEIRAQEAIYVPPGKGVLSGGWTLRGVTPKDIQCNSNALEVLDNDSYFLRTSITFEHLLRKQSWFQFASTASLISDLRTQDNAPRVEMAVLIHSRFTRPLAMLTLLFLGLPFVLSGTDRRMVSLVGISLVVSVAFQLFTQLCTRLGNIEVIGPELAAWLPVLIFGSLAVGLHDLVKT
jgi:lipopolysaccharide export system permease protein